MTDTDTAHSSDSAQADAPEPQATADVPLLFGKRVPLSVRQSAQYAGTDTEVDPKADGQFSDINRKENIVPVAWD